MASDAKGVSIYKGDRILSDINDSFLLNKEYFESTYDLTITKDDKYM